MIDLQLALPRTACGPREQTVVQPVTALTHSPGYEYIFCFHPICTETLAVDT